MATEVLFNTQQLPFGVDRSPPNPNRCLSAPPGTFSISNMPLLFIGAPSQEVHHPKTLVNRTTSLTLESPFGISSQERKQLDVKLEVLKQSIAPEDNINIKGIEEACARATTRADVEACVKMMDAVWQSTSAAKVKENLAIKIAALKDSLLSGDDIAFDFMKVAEVFKKARTLEEVSQCRLATANLWNRLVEQIRSQSCI